MHDLTREKTKLLAEKNGWSLAHAEGYVDGQAYRRRGMPPSKHAQVGIDEYSLGFRAGYYDRKTSDPVPSKGTAAVPVGKLQEDAATGVQKL